MQLEKDADVEWELAIGSRNSSSRSIKVDLESGTQSVTRSLQWRKDFNSSPEIQNSTRTMSFTKRSLGDFNDKIKVQFFNEHTELEQSLYNSDFVIWLTQRPKSKTVNDKYIFIGAAIFEFLFVLALLYGAYFIRQSVKELQNEEIKL